MYSSGLYSTWAKITKAPAGGSTVWIDGLAGEVLRAQAFGSVGLNYLPFGGKLVGLSSGVIGGTTTPTSSALRLVSGQVLRGLADPGERSLVLRSGALYADAPT